MAVTISAAGSEVNLTGSDGSPGVSLNFSNLISTLPTGQTIQMTSNDLNIIRDLLNTVDIGTSQVTTVSGGAQMISGTVTGSNVLTATIVMPTTPVGDFGPINLPAIESGSLNPILLTLIDNAALTATPLPIQSLNTLQQTAPLSSEILQLLNSLPNISQIQISATNASVGTIGSAGGLVSFQGTSPTDAIVISNNGTGGAQLSMTGGSLIVTNNSGSGSNILANNATILSSDAGDQVRSSGSSNIVTAGGNDTVTMNASSIGGLIDLGSGNDLCIGSVQQGGGTVLRLGSGNNTVVLGGNVTSGLTNFINSSSSILSAVQSNSDLIQFLTPLTGPVSGSGSIVTAGFGNDTIFNLHTFGPSADQLTIAGGGYLSHIETSGGVFLTTVLGTTINIVGVSAPELISMFNSGHLIFA